VDDPAEAMGHERGEVPAVIDVGMGEEDRVQTLDIERERPVSALALVPRPLEQAAVEENTPTTNLKEVARTRDRPRASPRSELHVALRDRLRISAIYKDSPQPCQSEAALPGAPRERQVALTLFEARR
jgi:hypothetical protein